MVIKAHNITTSGRDPRTLMGTYTKINNITINGLDLDTSIVDTSAPIYQHIPEIDIDTGSASFIFKAIEVGWVISKTIPALGETATADMTCFEDDLFDCQYYKWYWGYNQYEYSIPTIKIMGDECKSLVYDPRSFCSSSNTYTNYISPFRQHLY